MDRLRDPENGCEWDLAQTHGSISRFAVEEAHELADAIERADWPEVRSELGDLALQVVFHSRMASEAGRFELADVLHGIADKMERRHPHIFGDGPNPGWEAIKAVERDGSPAGGALAGIARTLPALSRAQKLGARAARVGFDWQTTAGVLDKVVEELEEVEAALTEAERFEEFGDLLFTLVSWARHEGLDAEDALRRANAKFEDRFRRMEATEADLTILDAAGKEAAWRQAKAAQRAAKRDQSASDSRTISDVEPSSPSLRSSTSPRS